MAVNAPEKPKKKKKLTAVDLWKQQVKEHYESLDDLDQRYQKAISILEHPLATLPPQSLEDSYNFGWMRGTAMMVESMFEGKWYKWLEICEKQELTDEDLNDVSHYSLGMFPDGKDEVTTMLDKCMDSVYSHGKGVYDFIEWIGYALGISWFEKPNIPDTLWKTLYEEFILDLIYLYPSDYFSHFMSNYGQSGVADYFPTPLNVTIMMNKMVESESNLRKLYTDSHMEPCLGAGAMLLPSRSLNLVGTELTGIMTKVSAIQAFLFQPSLLYTPKPIVGLHANKDTMTINKYFEFNTDTRIYRGDSLLGEFVAPKNIFESDSEHINIYYRPLDLSLNDLYEYEEIHLTQSWESLDLEMQKAIVKSQARNFGFDVCLTNPPFSSKVNKYQQQIYNEIYERNELFIKKREQMLEDLSVASHSINKDILTEVQYKLTTAIKSKKHHILEDQLQLEI